MMYTNKKNVLELIALLKDFGISNVVISAGSRHIPFAVSVEQDDFFTHYSVIDERSAAYFAIGLIQQTKKPAVICCTSGTAVANYYPAVAEAYYQKLPLVVVTGDKPARMLNQNAGQMIPQAHIFKDVTKCEVDIPECEDADDILYANRLINEALLALDAHGAGPVHINVQESAPLAIFDTQKLPMTRRITRHEALRDISPAFAEEIARRLLRERVMVVFGQHLPLSCEERQAFGTFVENFRPAVISDLLGNLADERAITNSDLCARLIPAASKKRYAPDIVITAGGHMVCSGYEGVIAESDFEVWHVDSDGGLRDEYGKLKQMFRADFFAFCAFMNEIKARIPDIQADSGYMDSWLALAGRVRIPRVGFSDLYAALSLLEGLPNGSALHLANSNSVRFAQYAHIDGEIPVLCNRGTSGIDGCLSSAVGFAAQNEGLTFLLIGDLTFFYDSNGLWNEHLSPNLRILLNNNAVGELLSTTWKSFRNDSTQSIFGHNRCNAKGIAESMNVRYLSASSKKEFDRILPEFLNPQADTPILFEVFTELGANETARDELFSANQSVDRAIYRKIKAVMK